MGGGLAEADAGVGDDPRAVDAGGDTRGDARVEPVEHVGDRVDIVRRGLHRRRRPLRVHQDDRAAPRRDQGERGGVESQRRDVVDQHRASVERGGHHRGLARVDRDGNAVQPGEDRRDTGEFVFDRDFIGTRPGRFAAEVDDARPRRHHRARRRDRVGTAGPQRAVAEAVGGDVDDAHDVRPVESQAGDGRARGDQRVAQAGDAVAGFCRQGGDGAGNIAECDHLRRIVDRQPDRGEAQPTARQRLAVAEACGADVNALRQDPASSAGKAATVAMARSVVSTAPAA